ncbi:MAG: protein kinase [Planctomycetes bacterium]|nr:protein kinase [Planctomycetota bacterium]
MDPNPKKTRFGFKSVPQKQDLNTAELTPPPSLCPKELGPQDATVVKHHQSANSHRVSAAQDYPVHFREDDLSDDPLLKRLKRDIFLGRSRPTLDGIPILAALGRGGMGSVYYAFHPRLKVEIALKVLAPDLARKHGDLVERFQLEAQIAARVKSPHLVGVIDVNQDQGLHYLVMEYVHGTSADQYLRQQHGPLPEAVVLDLCAAACEGLAAAHDAGVIHRDVKPANIMIPVMQNGRVPKFKASKIADLGIARLDERVGALTQTHASMGSPGYMPPEQVTDAQQCSQASDVFSMGATMYALLAGGRAPFARASYAEALLATVREAPAPLRESRRDLTPGTAAMIDRCLSKNPADRFQDASALLREIRICRASLTAAAPTRPEPARRAGMNPRVSSASAQAVSGTSAPMVLLSVEDNETEQLVMKYLVRKMPWPVEIYQATSAEEALDLLQRITPDVILTDICMQDMDGYEFIEKIRALPGHDLTPIVVKSAIAEEVGKKKSLHIGADAYLQKPVRAEMLEKTFSRMLARHKNNPAKPDEPKN